MATQKDFQFLMVMLRVLELIIEDLIYKRRTDMTNKLLGIIAINLTIITGLMILQSIPTATAQSGVQKIAICNEYGSTCLRSGQIRNL